MKVIKDTCYKGTRILLGNEKRTLINRMIDILITQGFEEISIPIIQYQDIFENKVGTENNNLMFNFKDRGDRDLCLAPEYTAVIQKLALNLFKYEKDKKLFYVQECFRGENPQAGRYRQFTQLGVEILNPAKDYMNLNDSDNLALLSSRLLEYVNDFKPSIFDIQLNTRRGLDYYKDGKGFEITCEELGSSKQICGGGEYDGGVGFAIGIDRLLLLNEINKI